MSTPQFMHSSLEASKMLEAALQQMDGIIAGNSKFCAINHIFLTNKLDILL